MTRAGFLIAGLSAGVVALVAGVLIASRAEPAARSPDRRSPEPAPAAVGGDSAARPARAVARRPSSRPAAGEATLAPASAASAASTAAPTRRDALLPRTLRSLRGAVALQIRACAKDSPGAEGARMFVKFAAEVAGDIVTGSEARVEGGQDTQAALSHCLTAALAELRVDATPEQAPGLYPVAMVFQVPAAVR